MHGRLTARSEGMLFAGFKTMSIIDPICEHCDEGYQGIGYRVTSEEDGVVLLDMIVCHSCSIEARRLGLKTKEHDIRHVAFK
jgi:hypothetical protein